MFQYAIELYVAIIFFLAIDIRRRYDTDPKTRFCSVSKRYEGGLQYGRALFLIIEAIIALQFALPMITGYEPLAMGLSATVDVIVRSTGLLLITVAAVLFTWPRVMEIRRTTWAGSFVSPCDVPNHRLVTWGPYRFIRHPFYASLPVGMLGVELALASYLVVIVLVIFVEI